MRKLLLLMVSVCFVTSAHAAEELTGEVRLACEALLCLSSGSRPAECSPSINHYFDIRKRKWSDTLDARLDFLNLCPAGSADDSMRGLVNAIAHGAGRCEVASLNTSLLVQTDNGTYISNANPAYCGAYYGHVYTDLQEVMPKYVGQPERGGYWVEARDYDAALAVYNARIAAEDAAAMYSGG